MKSAVLYTGTFDPYHLGHFWQLERSYKALKFEKVVIAIIRNNPRKQHATHWEDRVKLAEFVFSERKLPFKVEIRTIDYIEPTKLTQFTKKYLEGYKVTRTLASDSVVEFIENKALNSVLTMFDYVIVVRPLVNLELLNTVISTLPPEIKERFSYKIVHEQKEDDISATNIRKDPALAHEKGYITQKQLEFIKQKGLYKDS